MFVVKLLTQKIGIDVANCTPSYRHDVKLSFANGMIGALPVFNTYQDALTYCKDESLILEIQETGKWTGKLNLELGMSQ